MEEQERQERQEYECWKQWINAMFQAARVLSHDVPTRYEKTLMRSMVHHILEQHWGGTEYEKEYVYSCYEKWYGEPYREDEDEE